MNNSYQGYEVGDRVFSPHWGIEGTVVEVGNHPVGYIGVVWDDGGKLLYGLSIRPISDISLLV